LSQGTTYRHGQSGRLIRILLGIVFAVSVIVFLLVGMAALMMTAIAGLVMLLIGWIFGSLTVTVTLDTLSWWFGPGVWRKRVPLVEIEACEPVRNRWWWGWGIRYYGKGWLYNVEGLDAVEIRLKSGKHIRVGTDEPEALANAVRQAGGIAPARGRGRNQ